MSTEKEYTRFINDPVMEPYFISMDDNCMTVNIKITPDTRYSDSGKDYNKIVGHYSNLGSALKSIAKDKANSKSYDSLHEYIDEYNNIINSLTEKFNF
jgi:uncharacterized protein YutD